MYKTDSATFSAVYDLILGGEPLDDAQKGALKDEIRRDPERVGYGGQRPEQVHLLLHRKFRIPNPVPQGYVVLRTRADDPLETLLIAKGVITQAEAENERKVLDPEWRDVIETAPRAWVLFGRGTLLTLEEVAEAMA